MKPAPFFYTTPSTVEEAIVLFVEHGDEAKLLADGQSLAPMMNFRLMRPEHLIDTASVLLVGHVPDDDRIASMAQTVPGQVKP